MIEIKINPNILLDDWINYVDNHAESTVYHLPGWQKVLEKTFGFKPIYLFAFLDQEICGILPLFEIDSFLTGNRIVSLPFSYICGPLSDSIEIEKILLDKACELIHGKKKYLEIRSIDNLKIDLPVSQCFNTYQIELDSDIETVWKKLDKGSVRWAIGKAKRDGVEVIKTSGTEDIKAFYELNQKTKKRLGVPGHPLNLFLNIKKYMPNNMELYIAKYDDKIIAGVFNLVYKQNIIYAYGASDKNYLKYHPNNLAIWQSIEEGCERGYKIFDFGKVGDDDANLTSFKKRWGTVEKQLYYYFFPSVPTSLSINRKGLKYRLVTFIWKMLPSSVIKKIGLLAFKQLD